MALRPPATHAQGTISGGDTVNTQIHVHSGSATLFVRDSQDAAHMAVEFEASMPGKL